MGGSVFFYNINHLVIKKNLKIIMSGYTSAFSSSYSSSRGYSSTTSSSFTTSSSSSGSRWTPSALGGSYTVETSYSPRATDFLSDLKPSITTGGRTSGRWYPMAMGK